MKFLENRLKFAIISCAGWFPIALYSIFIKKVNIELRYFPLFYRFSGLEGRPAITDRLFIYQDDFLISFLLIPLLIACLVYLFPRKKTIFLIALVSVITLLLLFANMHSWGTMGKPLGYSALIDAAIFALQSPKFISMYVDYDSWLKLFVLGLSSLAGYGLARTIASVRHLNTLVASAVVCVLIGAAVAAGLGLRSNMKRAEIFRNFIFLSATAFQETKTSVGGEKMSGKEALQKFRHVTGTQRNEDSPYTAKAKGNDLIVFIMETGPVEFMDLEHDIASFPTISRLQKNSLIAYRHYATYPGSAQSLFSLFFSIYPPFNYYQSCISNKEHFGAPFPGFVSGLTKAGYHASLYLPYTDTIPLDKILHNNTGFDRIYYAQEHELQEENYDRMAWEEMKKDIRHLIEQGQPYVAVFMPQIGHAPWKGRPDSISVREYGKRLAVLQDQWLSELVAILEEEDRLDKTVLVVTADHGIRTAKEDPDFNMGFIDDYSHHVPLLIYAPSAFTEPLVIRNKTSHLDISPSLIDLFGLSDAVDTDMEQGMNLWDLHTVDRVLYYLGNWHCDADGYSVGERYFMYNAVLDLCFENTLLNFSFDQVIRDSEQAEEVKNTIRQIYTIQENLYSDFLCGER